MSTEAMTEVELDAVDEAALERLGAGLGGVLHAGLVVLQGPLGAGKTTFCRGLLRGRGHLGAVKSPTYTLVESYVLPTGTVHHFDLYRLTDPEELEFIGLRDYLQSEALCLVEWPERAVGILPRPDIVIDIQYVAAGRKVRLEARSEHGSATLLVFSAKKS